MTTSPNDADLALDQLTEAANRADHFAAITGCSCQSVSGTECFTCGFDFGTVKLWERFLDMVAVGDPYEALMVRSEALTRRGDNAAAQAIEAIAAGL